MGISLIDITSVKQLSSFLTSDLAGPFRCVPKGENTSSLRIVLTWTLRESVRKTGRLCMTGILLKQC